MVDLVNESDLRNLYDKMPYSFKTRFENDEGKLGTNPEELIRLQPPHAGCFNMKLSFVLNEAGYNPVDLNTDAVLTFVDGKIISIELDKWKNDKFKKEVGHLNGNVPGVSQEGQQ